MLSRLSPSSRARVSSAQSLSLETGTRGGRSASMPSPFADKKHLTNHHHITAGQHSASDTPRYAYPIGLGDRASPPVRTTHQIASSARGFRRVRHSPPAPQQEG